MTNNTQSVEEFYLSVEHSHHTILGASLAVREFGNGPALVFIHGFPTHGYTWRKLLPALAESYRCYVIDLPGMGDSDWIDRSDFSFTMQAARIAKLFDSLGIAQCGLIAHDTGATIARVVAANNPDRVTRLVAFNTEIPEHRPPWISTYQTLAAIPGANLAFRLTMRSKMWLRSSMGAQQFYSDKSLLNMAENIDPYISPVTQSARRMEGLLKYLRGIEWPVVDGMKTMHRKITADTLFIWGQDDKTFPLEAAKVMPPQFNGNAKLVPIHGALLPHEESPEQVLSLLNEFLGVDV